MTLFKADVLLAAPLPEKPTVVGPKGPAGSTGAKGDAGFDGPRYVYDPLAGRSTGNTFRTWGEVETAVSAGQMGASIVFARSGSYTISRSMDLRRATLGSLTTATGQVTVTLAEGAVLDNAGGLQDGIVVVVRPTTEPAFRFSSAGASEPAVFVVSLGAALRNESSTGMAAFPDVTPGSYLVVAFLNASQRAVPASTAPLVRCTGGTLIAPIFGAHSCPGEEWATDSVGTSLLQYQCDSTFPETPPITPGFAPANVIKLQGSTSRSVSYTPSNPADWAWSPTVPSDVGSALDMLASKP